MERMFYKAYGMKNHDLSGWTVSSVTDITRMFFGVNIPSNYLPPFNEDI
uniref:BspA family leucine-rich repeat surface protein n=1 Tax=viral metagenome TaxID=1070528 RepID=A0A6C0LJM7_9ZZZZ